MNVRHVALKALRGGKPEKVPWNIHHQLLRRGTLERALRNAGLSIVDKGHSAYFSITENVSTESKTVLESGVVTTYTRYHTPVGTLTGKQATGPDGSPWVKEYPVKKLQDLAVLEFITQDTAHYPDYESILQAQKDLGDDGIVVSRMLRSPLQRLLTEWMGVETFVFLHYDYPEPIEHLLETIAGNDRPAFEITARSPAEVVWSAENITSSITSPRLFESYCRPYYNRMAEILHSEGKLYGLHLDGNLAALVDSPAHTRIDFIEGLNPPPMGDVSIADARAVWPGKVLWVNFPGCVLLSDDEGVIMYFARELLKQGMEGGSFLLTLTEDFPIRNGA